MTADGEPADPYHPEAALFCATGALLRAGFELTGEAFSACKLREDACKRLLPAQDTPRFMLDVLNDTSIGYITVLQVFASTWSVNASRRDSSSVFRLRV